MTALEHVANVGCEPGQPWPTDRLRKSDVSVHLMSARMANAYAAEHHYLHRPRVGQRLCYEVQVRGAFMGILVYARPMVCAPIFGYQPKEIIELARVWFKENPKNLGSCAIRASLKRLSKDWPGTKAVISWCDTSRFDGALYKATGFEYCGLSRVRSIEPSHAKHAGGRPGRRVQGDRLTPKQRWLIRLSPAPTSLALPTGAPEE